MNGLFRFISKLFGGRRSGAQDRDPAQPPPTGDTTSPAPGALSNDVLGSEGLASEGWDSQAVALGTPSPRVVASPRVAPPPALEPNVVLLELTEDEEIADEPDDESDEADPTLGRYEELRVPVLDADEIDAQRAVAEAQGLSGPHKVFPHDPAGPGSLAETLARLEAKGRVTSRICEDAEHGFYVIYEPIGSAPDGGAAG